jgi:hypothetical protein
VPARSRADDGTAPGTATNTDNHFGTQQAGSADQTVTVVGCIQSEADYRKARNLRRGGTAGTGVGVGNEFVLIDAKMASAGAPPAAGAAPGATGAAAQAYKLTAANEGKASPLVAVNASRSPARSSRRRPEGRRRRAGRRLANPRGSTFLRVRI